MDFLALAKKRFSERHFSSTPIEEEKLNKILEAGRVAPTARNRQPQRLLIVQSERGLQKMDFCTACRYNAPCVIVLAYDTQAAAESPAHAFGPQDTSIVATHMMLEAADLGIHSCWVGLIDSKKIHEQFNMPETYDVLAVMPMGYPSEESEPSANHYDTQPIENLCFFENYTS